MRARLALVCSALWLAWAASAASTAAQARVGKIIPSSPTSRGAGVQRAGALRAELADTVQVLLPGDVLFATDSSLVELGCVPPHGSTYRLKGPFRVMIDVPIDTTCHVNVLAGHGDVIAESPTTTTAGGVPLGSKGTQYAVDVTREGGELLRRVATFEGEVIELRTGRTVPQGFELAWTARQPPEPTPVTPAAIERSAAVYARFDLAAAAERAPDAPGPPVGYEQLKQLHAEVLAKPTDTASRVLLAKRQIDIKADEQAAYNLRLARVTNDSALRRYQIDPAVIRANPQLRDRVYRASSRAVTRPPESGDVQPEGGGGGGGRGRSDRLTMRPGATKSATRGATMAATLATPTTDGDLQLIAAGQVDEAVRNLESRVAGPYATSRDEYALAKAYASPSYAGRDATKVREHASRALILHASDAKLAPAELRELGELLARVP